MNGMAGAENMDYTALFFKLYSVQHLQQSFRVQWLKEQTSKHIVSTVRLFHCSFTQSQVTGYGAAAGCQSQASMTLQVVQSYICLAVHYHLQVLQFLVRESAKYTKDGKVNVIPGHNILIGALGVLILWVGWFGFNPASTGGLSDGGVQVAAKVFITTNLAACAAAITTMFFTWIRYGKPDVSMTLNGVLGGSCCNHSSL